MVHKPDVKPVILTTRAARAEPMPTEIAREYHIVIADPLNTRDDRITQRNLNERYDVDAFHIAQALRAGLPGGTFDRLVIELLRISQSDRAIRLLPVGR